MGPAGPQPIASYAHSCRLFSTRYQISPCLMKRVICYGAKSFPGVSKEAEEPVSPYCVEGAQDTSF